MNVEELLKMGFSYEDLYNKGILVVKQADPPADPPEDPPADPPADPPEDPPADPPADPENDVIKALREEIAGLKTAIQNINIKGAERSGGGGGSEPMSVEQAILGLVKEM